jgi:hypothetical protein
MQSVASFRIISPILGVHPVHRRGHLVNIPVGAVITTLADLREPGLVAVTFDGEDLLVFTRDIQERTERIESDARADL